MPLEQADKKISQDEFSEMTGPLALDLQAMFQIGMEKMIDDLKAGALDGQDVEKIFDGILKNI